MTDASVSIRLNPYKESQDPGGIQVPWSRFGRILEKRPVFTLDPLLHAGCYYVQDSSAMYVGHLFRKILPKVKGLKVLDLCAAPGGKTTDIAASLREVCGDDFLLISNEVMKARVGVLRENVAKWGDPNVLVTSFDPSAFAKYASYFDIVVADVPCSGEGMFRKDPRAEKEWSPAVVELCSARQKRILADVWPALKEGGTLLYSTCTYEQAENDDNLQWAANELGGEIIPCENEFSQFGVEQTAFGNLLRVGKVPGEGQWAGALVKTASERVARGVCENSFQARRLEETLVPDADYALSIKFDKNAYPQVDVNLETALKYLHRDTLVLPDAAVGYNVICYLGHPLGFVKNIGTRCNNLLPKSRRILMNI